MMLLLVKVLFPMILGTFFTPFLKLIRDNISEFTRDKLSINFFLSFYPIFLIYTVIFLFNIGIGVNFFVSEKSHISLLILSILIIPANIIYPIISFMTEYLIYTGLFNKTFLYKENESEEYKLLLKGSNKLLSGMSVVMDNSVININNSKLMYSGNKKVLFNKEHGYYDFIELERTKSKNTCREIDNNYYFLIALPIILYSILITEFLIFNEGLRHVQVNFFLELILLLVNSVIFYMKKNLFDKIEKRNENDRIFLIKNITDYIK